MISINRGKERVSLLVAVCHDRNRRGYFVFFNMFAPSSFCLVLSVGQQLYSAGGLLSDRPLLPRILQSVDLAGAKTIAMLLVRPNLPAHASVSRRFQSGEDGIRCFPEQSLPA